MASARYELWKIARRIQIQQSDTERSLRRAMPKASAIIVRKNSMKTVAYQPRRHQLAVGSVPSARIASICSVTFIEPSSDAMPEAFRPETINPVSTGPSSFTIDSATSVARHADCAKLFQRSRRLQRQHASGKKSCQHHNRQRTHADRVHLGINIRHVARARKQVRNRPPAQQGILLHGSDYSLLAKASGETKAHVVSAGLRVSDARSTDARYASSSKRSSPGFKGPEKIKQMAQSQ